MADDNILKDLVVPIISICSFVVSIISILMSGIVLYLGHLKKANITIISSEHMNIGYFSEGNFHLIIPLLILNNGATTTVINRLSILIQEIETGNGYLLEPYSFQKIDANGAFQAESLFSPIALTNKQNLTKLILFRSSLEDLTDLQKLKPDDYSVILLGWTEDSSTPDINSSFKINISKEIAKQLRINLKNKTGTTIRVSQTNWSNFKPKAIDKNQIRSLMNRNIF